MADEKLLQSLKRNPKVLELYSKSVPLHKEDAGRWRGTCPFGERHKNGKDRTPSFDVYKFDDGTYGYKCLGCGSSGNIFQFVMDIYKVTFEQSIKRVASYLEGSWAEGKDDVEGTFHRPLPETKKTYMTFPVSNCDKFVQDLIGSKEAKAFLIKRGISVDAAVRLKIGFRQSMTDEVKVPEELRDKGWLVFPYIIGNKVVRVKFRSIVSKVFTQLKGMEQKGLYNSEAADPLQPLFLVEGELDVAALATAGFNAVSLFNSTHDVTPEDKDTMMTSSELYLAGDSDGAVGEEKMKQIWTSMQDNAFLLKWPDGIKDANDLLKASENVQDFHDKVEQLMSVARSQPMPGVYSLQEAMLNSNRTDLINHPDRFRFCWKGVDDMAICLPGAVIALTASSTGMGKTQFLMQATLDAAVRNREVVLNYQAEMSTDEISNMVAARVLGKDRNDLKHEDYVEAAKRIKKAKYYIGSNDDLQNSTQVLDLIEKAIKRLSPTVVVLDHIHHVCQNVRDEIQDQSNAMKRIKAMARKYGVKFFVVGQPRKANQQGRGKEIYMSDMKGSEAIQSAADVVFILHREFVKDFDPAHPPMDMFAPETKITLHKGRTKGRGAAACTLILRGTIATFAEEMAIANNVPESETFPEQGHLI